jgi:transposase InsO family protein
MYTPYCGWQLQQQWKNVVDRGRRKEGLKVRAKPQRIRRQGVSTGFPTQTHHLNQVWIWDFIFDRTDKGSTLKMLMMLDAYSRRCLAIRVERQIVVRTRFMPPASYEDTWYSTL